jgi:hypothetical protein
MKRKTPSPATVISIIALIVALSGTAVAAVAVDYARNSGAVDGKSAVAASASRARAAGKLVATARSGRDKGQIPGKFLRDAMRGGTTNLTQYLRVVDNADGPIRALAIIPGVGRLDAQCQDQNPTPGVESTQTLITFTAGDPGGVNVSRLLGRDIDRAQQGQVFSVPFQTAIPVINFSDSLFQLIIQAHEKTVLVMGSSRSDSNESPNAACLIWGISFRVG